MPAADLDTGVVVVGAGPVGLMLAGELRLGGAAVTVLEQLPAPSTESRASTLHARTVEVFDQRGLLEPLGSPPVEPRGHFGGLPLDLGRSPTPYPGQWKVPQTRVEQLLADRARGLGARLLRGHEVRSLAVAADHVEVGGPGGRFRAAYVVGCDGEESTVRQLGGIGFPGRPAGRELLAADVLGLEVPERRFERLPAGLATAARRPGGVTRLMVHAYGRAAAGGKPSFAAVAADWRRVTGEDISAGTPLWLHAFGDASRLAERYRAGRVLLAGDAAHQQLPAGGQALNLGLQDAVNLGWKLAAVVAGRAPDRLLDTYHDERREVGRRVLGAVQAQALLLLGGAEVTATREVLAELMHHSAVRDRLAAVITGLDVRYGAAPGAPELLGARLPPGPLHTADGPTTVAALLRPARGLLLTRSAGRYPAARAWADSVDVVELTGAADGPLAAANAVLVRPDGHVAWIAGAGTRLGTALRRWFGARAPAPARAPAADTTTHPRPTTNPRNPEERGARMPSKVMATNGSTTPGKVHQCDVVILGSGLAGSITGAILARQGANVVLADAASHPRFAVGESMTPQLIEWLHILADRFDVPEIRHLLDIKAVTRNIGPFHGKKQSFGFIKQTPGQEPDPREATMFVIPKLLTEASHLFRQDTDSYYFHIAARYGCTTRQNWRAADLDFDDDGVTVTGTNGEVFRSRYLIDASGFRSPLADKFDLREQPARFKHHSRSLFTHYIGIKPFDDVCHHPRSLRPPAPWHGGTLHHMIERGWFWIIPFDNVKGSMNPLCSVGLTFDERLYPKPKDMTPEEEFHHYLDMYPSVKRQFTGAQRVREWVSTDRLQYSSKHSIGYRWCLMSHAAGFIDPLFSRGLSNTFEVVYALTSRLLEALKDDDFSVERFEYVDRVERGLLQYNDDLVNSSFISFGHFRLWNAVFRVWGAFLTPGVMRLTKARMNYALDHDERHLKELEDTAYPGLWWPESAEFKNLLELTAETCEKYEVGELTGDEAADLIFAKIQESGLVNPVFGWKDGEDMRFVLPTTAMMARFMYWGVRKAPPEMRELVGALATGVVRTGLRGQKLL